MEDTGERRERLRKRPLGISAAIRKGVLRFAFALWITLWIFLSLQRDFPDNRGESVPTTPEPSRQLFYYQ